MAADRRPRTGSERAAAPADLLATFGGEAAEQDQAAAIEHGLRIDVTDRDLPAGPADSRRAISSTNNNLPAGPADPRSAINPTGHDFPAGLADRRPSINSTGHGRRDDRAGHGSRGDLVELRTTVGGSVRDRPVPVAGVKAATTYPERPESQLKGRAA